MPGVQTLPGKIGNFVLPEAAAAEGFHGSEVHVRLRLVVREVQHFLVVIEGGAFLDFQGVAADVFRVQAQDVVQRFLPVLQVLPGQAVHQVDGHVAKTRLADALVGGGGLCVGVGTAEFFQNFIVVGLNAQTDPVEALGVKPVEQPVGNGIRVALHGDLGIRHHVEVPADGGEDHGQTVGTEEGGGAAAKVDGVHLVAGRQLTGFLDMVAYRVQIAVHQLVVLGGHGVEVAVLALAAAEGDMDVKSEGRFVRTFIENRHGIPPGVESFVNLRPILRRP